MPENSAPARSRVLFLAPEPPTLGGGGGGIRSASLLEYLRTRYSVDVATFDLRPHSKSMGARVWRNSVRLLRGNPPLLDRFAGYEQQVEAQMRAPRYAAAVVEHFWCAPYAPLLRSRCERLILDLHNIESRLARTHAQAAGWPKSWASARFADAYERLESRWIPEFDAILVASSDDAGRIDHANVHVYPNAIPSVEQVPSPSANSKPAIIFTGNLEYHPNSEAVRWFRSRIWPRLREEVRLLEWRLAGVNAEAIASMVEGDSRIRVLGRVENAIETLAQADIAIVPLLSGSGTRFKILEAWAAARPVVSTTIGAEGLGARSGEHLLIADQPVDFANAVVRLLNDPDLRCQIGKAGRALYLERYTWPVAWRSLQASGII